MTRRSVAASEARTELWVVTPDDWLAWSELRLAALREAPYAFSSTFADWQGATEQRWRERLAVPGGHNAIALLDGARVGMVSGLPSDAQTLELIGMWVAPAARRKGVGRALIGAVATWARDASKRRVRLEVRRGNSAAFELYRAFGFRDGEQAGSDAEEEIEMLLSLPQPDT
jgi:ribosomal protein S18 acetylase RimI-like enzyme